MLFVDKSLAFDKCDQDTIDWIQKQMVGWGWEVESVYEPVRCEEAEEPDLGLS